MHVLLIEDDPLVATGIAAGLRLHGLTVDHVDTAGRVHMVHRQAVQAQARGDAGGHQRIVFDQQNMHGNPSPFPFGRGRICGARIKAVLTMP